MSAVGAGNLIEFPVDRPGIFRLPDIYYQLQKNQPFAKVKLKLDGSEAWLITRYDDVREVLVNENVSANPSSPGYPQITAGHAVTSNRPGDFVYLDDPQHDHFRGLLTREFLVKSLEAMRSDVEWIIDSLADQMLDKGPELDLVKEFALAVPSLVICKMLGVSYDDHELIQESTSLRMNINNTAEETTAAVERLIQYLDTVVTEKEKKPTADILSRLAAHVSTGKVSHEEVVNMARLLVSAGHETTANLISLGTVLLIQYPEQMQALLADPSLAAKATEEILRYTSIVHTTPRRAALKDIEVNGFKIAAGDGIIPLTAMANRDSTVFEDPDRFDISRGSRNHLAFNFGPHHCLGANLARMEMQIVMQRFYKRFPGLALAKPFEEINFKMDSLMLGAYELPVTWG